MNDNERDEMLSAYLDGESEDPDAVRRLLESDPHAFQHYRALQSLTKGVKALPEVDVNPAFAKGVMARVRQEPVAPRRRRAWHWAVPAAALAASVAVAVAGYRMLPAPVVAPVENDMVAEIAAMSDQELESLLTELTEALPEASAEAQPLPMLLAVNAMDTQDEAESDDMLTYVADLDASYSTAATLSFAGVTPVLDSLNEQEASDLYDELLNYMQEG